MKLVDEIAWSAAALSAHRMRSVLSMLGIAIGVAAVILLTSIGEGTRRYVLDQFTQFGTNILTITPGKTKTTGMPGILGGTTRKLTIDDAEVVAKLRGVEHINPHTYGAARVEADGRGRSVVVYGVTAGMIDVLQFRVGQGSFVPPGDPRRGASIVVLGPTLKQEIFGDDNALGSFVRISGERFRVIGIMASKGKMLGFDLDDAAYIPLASHMRLFNRDELQEIGVTFSDAEGADAVSDRMRAALMARHDNTEDFTITTQAAMLDVFGKVMTAVTFAVGAIAGISLFVGAIGILTMMWISVNERTGEIGLLRALGADARRVQRLFLIEAVALSVLGGTAGLLAGLLAARVAHAFVPAMPLETPPVFMVAALVVSTAVGLVSGVLPARRAARLDPIEALRSA
jgi:putative ABC transport system permease protein